MSAPRRLAVRAALAAAALAAAPSLLRAHEGRPLAPHDLWTAQAWSLEPGVVLALALSGALYVRGTRALRRGATARAAWRRPAAAFAAGWVALAIALLSPIHPLGEALFSAHMLQHELLIALAAPLLVLGRPLVPMLWALPIGARRRVGAVSRARPVRGAWGAVTHPVTTFALHGVALWVWHLPGPYQATLRSDLAHTLQHASFVGTALLFWWSVLHARGERRGRGLAIASLFATTLHTGVLGALLTLAPSPWYPAYGATSAAWGLTALEDQQLAGLVMWIPACLAYVIAALWLAARWLDEAEHRAAAHDAWRRQGPAARAARATTGAVVLLLCVLALAACTPDHGEMRRAEAVQLTGGDPERGRAAIRAYGCGTCHTIAGVRGANSLVGPPLTGIVERAYVAGVLEHTPDNLQRWIREPQAVDPRTAMPNLGVSERDARDIAAYLYTLR